MASTIIITALPALKDHRYLRFVTLGLLYIAQGLPIGLFQVAIPAWLASQGQSAAQVGSFIAIVFLPWSFKLIAGPVMDRFSFPPMGRRRPWVLGAQAGIVLALLLIAVIDPDPSTSLMLLAGLGFCANSFGAIQDVAVDGMAIDILEQDERARANSFMFGGQVVGVSGSAALGSYALVNFGLGVAALILAIVVAIIMLVPLFIKERQGERLLPWTEGSASAEALESVSKSWSEIFSTLIRALFLPMSLLLILLEGLNRVGSGMLTAIGPVLTVQELGWLQTDFSQWVAFSGVAAAIFGVLLGPVVDRFGAKLALMLAVLVRAVMFAAVGFMEFLWQDLLFFKVVILISYLSGQVVTIAIISLFMQISFQRVAATQFAVYMALANLSMSMGSALIAPMDGVLSYSQMFYVMATLNVLFLLLWPLFNLVRHRSDVQVLESKINSELK
jgi:PAT family beta-lactamase induction signal transducer AmpG